MQEGDTDAINDEEEINPPDETDTDNEEDYETEDVPIEAVAHEFIPKDYQVMGLEHPNTDAKLFVELVPYLTVEAENKELALTLQEIICMLMLKMIFMRQHYSFLKQELHSYLYKATNPIKWKGSEAGFLRLVVSLNKMEKFWGKNGKISENQGKNGNIAENKAMEMETSEPENNTSQIKEDMSELELLLIPQHANNELKQQIADKIRAIQRERNKVTTAEWRLRNKQGLEKTNKANIEKGNEELKRLREGLAELYVKANLNGKAATLFEN